MCQIKIIILNPVVHGFIVDLQPHKNYRRQIMPKKEIRLDRKYYVPVMNGKRQFHLSSNRKDTAIRSIVSYERKSWPNLKSQGWTIEQFWESEYE